MSAICSDLSQKVIEPSFNQSFQSWFGDSKVVDDEGSPVPVFHGTPGPLFDAFEAGRPGKVSFIGIPVDVERHGFYFADDLAFAESFARQGESRSGSVIEVYLNIRRPLHMLESGIHWRDVEALVAQGVDRNWLENHAGDARTSWEAFDGADGKFFVDAVRAAGFDGVLMNELCPDTDGLKLVWIAFEPGQVKSVHNPGTWNPESPRLRDARSMAGYGRAPRPAVLVAAEVDNEQYDGEESWTPSFR